ncbi:MAG: hypothetical protein IAG10_10825 [Planctomycetaceae bacterium]|nr:hypothetical protein [Planctomycetaceae bacterium]
MRRLFIAAVLGILSLVVIFNAVNLAMNDIRPDSQLTPELVQERRERFAKRPWSRVMRVGIAVVVSGFFTWQYIYTLRKLRER